VLNAILKAKETNKFKCIGRIFAPAMLCLLLGGCGPWIGDPVVEVIGEVKLDGNVLTNALVVFVPTRFRNDEGVINPLAFGKTDGTGRFELESQDHRGVLLGRYRVLIFRADGLKSGAFKKLATTDAAKGEQSTQAQHLSTALALLLNEPQEIQSPDQNIPARYNLNSELEYIVDAPVGIVYPVFELTSD
jgi:hypothetical protein